SDGACKEVVHRFDPRETATNWPEPKAISELARERAMNPTPNLPTLLNMPIQQCWPLDGGRFITMPCVVTKDPDTGERNVGMYRIQIYDDRTTGMHWQLQKVGARHGRRYYETGARMPVAIFLGGDPVYPATIVGIPPMEDFYIGTASVKLFLPIIKMNFPEIVDIALPAEGVFHNLVFVSIKKTYPMQAYKIMHGLWGMGQMMFTKYMLVVDDDVNVHTTSDALSRLCANTDPQRDSIFTKGPADVLDH